MTDMHFVHETQASRVVFGAGKVSDLGREIARLGSGALVLTTPEQADLMDLAEEVAPGLVLARFDGAAMHTPVSVTEAALAKLQDSAADCIVALGGGSTTGLGKALALRTGLPIVAVPTTYAGSEMTPILGETRDGRKTTLRDAKVLPRTVIYDPALTLSLPPIVSSMSGLNAMAHAVEALYAPDATPVNSLMAQEGVRLFARALPVIAASPSDAPARADALVAAWLCGTCLGRTTMGLHHKLAHVLGGTFDLPHAATHSVLLPHVTAYNADAAPDAMACLSRALGADDPARALHDLAAALGVPTDLASIGMPQDGLPEATRQVFEQAYANPREIDPDAIGRLLRRAFAGDAPSRD